MIIANGFSCQEQISQTTNRRALHLAQVLQMALREGPSGRSGPAEKRYPAVAALNAATEKKRSLKLALAGAALVVAGGLAWAALKRKETNREGQTAHGDRWAKNIRARV